jgi:hypothetical protein
MQLFADFFIATLVLQPRRWLLLASLNALQKQLQGGG